MNRNEDKAQSLAGDILASDLIDDVKADSISKISSSLKDADILINTTPLGMHPNVEGSVASSDDMHENLVVFDAVYNPHETLLLKEAAKAGAKPVYGIKMLLYQGAESFKIWTGSEPPIDVMENALKQYLGR